MTYVRKIGSEKDFRDCKMGRRKYMVFISSSLSVKHQRQNNSACNTTVLQSQPPGSNPSSTTY